MKCGKCGAENRDTNAFCDNCGAYLEDTVTGENTEEKNAGLKNKSAKKQQKKQRKLPVIFGKKNKNKKNAEPAQTADAKRPVKKTDKKKKLIAGAVFVLAVVVVSVTAALVFSGEDENTAPVVYVKENSVMAQKVGENAPFVLSDNFSEASNAELVAVFNQDGDKLLYSESYTTENGTNTYKLYYRDIMNETSQLSSADSSKGLFLASNVYSQPKASKNFKRIAYLRSPSDNGGKLKVHNLKEEISIDTNVVDFYISADGKNVIYLKKNGNDLDLYECKVKSNAKPVFIESAVNEVYILDGDFDLYAFTKLTDNGNTGLFSVKKEKPSLINANVKEVFVANSGSENDGIYFISEKEISYNWSEIVTDDLYESDGNIKEPVRENYGSEDEYTEAKDLYDAKTARDSLRAAISDGVLKETSRELYVYTEKEPVLISEFTGKVYGVYDGAIVYSAFSMPENMKIKLSDLAQYGSSLPVPDGKTPVLAKGELFYAKTLKNAPVLINEDAAHSDAMFFSGNTLYVAENCDKDFELGDIVKWDMKKETGTRIDAGVFIKNVCFTASGSVYYVKDMKESTGTLYCYNGKKTEEIQQGVAKLYPAGNESVFFMTDYNESAKRGTLNLCEKFTPRHVDTNVYEGGFTFRAGSEVFYIKGYSSEKGSGNLYRSRSKKEVSLVSEYVSQIF